MSWSSLRVFGAVGVWLAMQTGCGGNPEVSNVDPGTDGGTSTGGTKPGGGGTAGSLNIDTGGTDGNGEGGDGPSPDDYVCGNKVLEPGEFCDDGNTTDGDGCSADCTEVDLDFDCSAVGEPCVQVVICGNGVLEGDEVCDDANEADGDGCTADCSAVETGFVCVRPGKECVAVSVCGNGTRERGEQCDDGNPESLDGCDSLCQVESGFFCTTPGDPCLPLICGNGERTPDEACDDGTDLPDDGCDENCDVRQGWRCNTAGCQPICGDGRVEKGEACDDGARVSGDGCSAGCTVEPFFTCTAPAHQTSVCTSSIACGNSVLDPGEVCDPPGTNGCKAGCKSFDPITIPAMCNNGKVEAGEGCEPPSPTQGCSATCQVEAGWTCPQPGYCFENPRCGDGNVDTALGETCENPPAPMVPHVGCGANCKALPDYTCSGLTWQDSQCFKPVCGDGVIQPGEQCDDGTNTAAQDGCSACVLTTGWACPTQGTTCVAKCGDGLKRGLEECDDGNKMDGDGCNKGCKVEPGYKCPTPNMTCDPSVCGDNTLDKGEGCDFGDVIAGDGCGPTCLKEPGIMRGPSPVVEVSCGDGLVTGDEECDDGNDDNGDGCSATCDVERPAGCPVNSMTCGWVCDPKLTLPEALEMRITYRDFKSANALTDGGHPDFQYNTYQQVRGITGNACNTANAGTADCGRLDNDGKPPLIRENQQTQATGNRPWDNMPYTTGTGIMNKDTFSLWFRDSNPNTALHPNGIQGYHNRIVVTPFVKTITLDQDDTNLEKYSYESGAFFPLAANEGYGNLGAEVEICDTDNNPNNGTTGGVRNQVNNCNGCGATCKGRNFGFTSELRYFFQYKGGEQLIFTGDDDVWVYVNGRLAVDLGGLHSSLSGQVVLGDDGNIVTPAQDSNCSAHGEAVANLPNPGTEDNPGCYTTAERTDDRDDRFDLEVGGLYEIVLFHAERHSDASNFRLTLQGFLAPTSFCQPTCGDGFVVGDEVCDDGPLNSDTIAGRCNTTCTAKNLCGDGVQQTGEACDDGTNTTLYRTANTPVGACAPGCKLPARCGDGIPQPGQNEKCDKGTAQNTGAYGGCTATCQLGGYCGDSMTNGPETCDKGPLNGQEYGNTSCGYDCQLGPHCGDAIPNGNEECDLGSAMNGQAGVSCDATCKKVPGCGDGIKQVNESCDYGQFYSDAYGGCTNMCEFGPRCGDGTAQSPYEECDDGTASNTGGYDGCTSTCDYGPRCGDGVTQTDEMEACDNGFNDDDYAFDDMSCGVGCTPPPSCGDGTVQASFELCDNGANNDDDAYDGCTTSCEFGPYCGDEVIDGPELCDDGADNVSYAPSQGGCSYDCQPAPYCGDAVRNGPEQCDLGTDANTGEYGTCNADCTFAPRCGDRIRQTGEQCDDGPGGSLSCTPTCRRRQVVQ